MSLPASDLTKKPDMRTTMELGAVLPVTAEVRDDHLFVGGVDMVELAREQGTALYVMDEADLRTRMETYREAFRSRYENSDVVYASKAFLNKEAARIVPSEGLCLDVSGGGELACALAAGLPDGARVRARQQQDAARAARGHPGRRGPHRASTAASSCAASPRSPGELGVVQAVYMRITPGVEADTHEYIRTGCEDSKFGFTMREDFAFKCVKRRAGRPERAPGGPALPHRLADFRAALLPRGRRGHGGAHGAHPRQRTAIEITELDVGGGLGIAYTADDKPASIDEFAEVTARRCASACAQAACPSRACSWSRAARLVATAGVTLYTVGILKTLPGIRKYVAIDGGMSDNIRTALYHADYEPVIANKAGQPRDRDRHARAASTARAATPWSSTCPCSSPTSATSCAVFGTGAYNMTMASNYNGQPRPAVVFVRDGASRVVTRRETYEDLYQRDL